MCIRQLLFLIWDFFRNFYISLYPFNISSKLLFTSRVAYYSILLYIKEGVIAIKDNSLHWRWALYKRCTYSCCSPMVWNNGSCQQSTRNGAGTLISILIRQQLYAHTMYKNRIQNANDNYSKTHIRSYLLWKHPPTFPLNMIIILAPNWNKLYLQINQHLITLLWQTTKEMVAILPNYIYDCLS